MPESGSVVKALEWYLADDERSVEAGIMENVEKRPAFHAVPLAREQEALLLAYMEDHRLEDYRLTRVLRKECPCDSCKRTRKVLS